MVIIEDLPKIATPVVATTPEVSFYTSYFAKLKDLPEDIVPISICGKAPNWYTGVQYKKLATKYSFFAKYKEDGDAEHSH